MQALDSEFVLVDGYHLAVHEDGLGLLAHRAEVIAKDEGRCHHTPHGEMRAVLVLRHAIAHLEHVGVVPMPRTSIFAQGLAETYALHDAYVGEALGMYTCGVEVAPDVRSYAPAVTDIASPKPRLVAAPLAHAEEDGTP